MTAPQRSMTAAELLEVTEVERLTLRPGDLLVLKCPMAVGPLDADALLKQLREAVPEATRIVLLDNGCDLAVLRAEG